MASMPHSSDNPFVGFQTLPSGKKTTVRYMGPELCKNSLSVLGYYLLQKLWKVDDTLLGHFRVSLGDNSKQ